MVLDLAEVLPQRAPFRFIDEVVAVSDEEAHCRFRFPTEGACFSLRMDPAMTLVEALAQTAAIQIVGQLAAADGRGRPPARVEGVLGGIDGLVVHARPAPGERVDLRARLRKRLGPVLLFDVAAGRGDEPLCEARLTVRTGGAP